LPKLLLVVTQDSDYDVLYLRLLSSGRVRVSFGDLERALQEHGLRQGHQARATATPPRPTCHAAGRVVDGGATERTIQASDYLLDIDPEVAQQFAAAVATRQDVLRLQSTE